MDRRECTPLNMRSTTSRGRSTETRSRCAAIISTASTSATRHRTGQKIEDNIIAEIVDKLENDAKYQKRRKAVRNFNARNKVLKRGIALTPVKFGISFTATHLNQAGALVHVYRDGTVHLNHGGTEMGQGLYIKVAQVVADEFGIGVDRIRINAADTSKVPNASATAASSGSDMNGKAAQNAAAQKFDSG